MISLFKTMVVKASAFTKNCPSTSMAIISVRITVKNYPLLPRILGNHAD